MNRLLWHRVSLPVLAVTSMLLHAEAVAESSATLYPAPAGVAASDLFDVVIDGQPAFVHPCNVGNIYNEQGQVRLDPPETTTPQAAAICSFDMSGPVDVTIRVKKAGALRSATVRPLRHHLEPVIHGDTITVHITHPGQYSIEPNGSPCAPLLLFANPPETNQPSADDPNVLYFGPGEHVMGWKSIKSGQTVYLAPGAVVYGHLIIGGAENVRVIGRGILDCSRAPRRGDKLKSNEFGRYDVAMHIGHCKNVLIEGITILDSPTWTMHVLNSSEVTVRNTKIISWRENGDGIDVNNSQHVRVENCFLRTWDDALVVKATLGRPKIGKPKPHDGPWSPEDAALYPPGLTRDVTFSDCVVWLDRAHALEIGFETNGTEIADICFRDIDVIHDNHLPPIDITNGDRARVHGIRYENIHLEDSHAPAIANFLAGKCYTSIDSKMGLDYGPIEDVLLKNIDARTSEPPRIVCDGQSIEPGAVAAKIRDVRLENVRINGEIFDSRRIERKGLVEPP